MGRKAWRRDTETGQYVQAEASLRASIADVLRAAAAGYAADGQPGRAAPLRKSARILEGREQPWDHHRSHHKKGSS